jgi:CRP-like cAMP-binding protein
MPVATVALPPTAVDLLDLDPALAAGIPPEDQDVARRACRGGIVNVPRGRWEVPIAAGERDDRIGLVIVRGMLCREIALRDYHMLELLGPRDVLQLPVATGRPRLGGSIMFTAAVDTSLVALGASFIRASARWPSLLATLLRRIEAQRQRLAIQGLIVHVPRAEHRILLALSHLADGWGETMEHGVALQLPLTHVLIGQLVASRRSTVTLAIRALEADGYVRRLDHGAWFITAAGQDKVSAIATTRAGTRTIGETLMLRQLAGDAWDESRALRAEAQLMRRSALGHEPSG